MTSKAQHITIIGGGAWGAAMASALQRNKALTITCLVRDKSTQTALQKGLCPRLPECPLPEPLAATTNPEILSKTDAIYLVLPASATIEALAQIAHYARTDCPVIFCAKGLIETDDGMMFLPEYSKQQDPHRPFAILSGPSFADEVIQGLPAALVAASWNAALSALIINHLEPSHLRIYSSDDPLGVAIGGAVKNVIALSVGICDGLGLGDNAKAALLTRGLAETQRLILHMGGQAKTISGLAGIGDLALTASGPHSRNMSYGLALGKGEALPTALAEGARSAPLLSARAQASAIDMPITTAVTKALQGADLDALITDLLARPAVKE